MDIKIQMLSQNPFLMNWVLVFGFSDRWVMIVADNYHLQICKLVCSQEMK